MKNVFAVLAAALLLQVGAVPASAQTTLHSRFENATYDWDAGRYAEALRAFEEILLTGGGDTYLKDIALLTGEWVRTQEIASDGTNPQWSADGTMFTYEVSGENGTLTRVATIQGGETRLLDEFVGTEMVFVAESNMVVYKHLRTGSELEAARAAAREGVTGEGRARFIQLRNALARVDARFTDIMVRDVTTGSEQQIPTEGLSVTEISAAPDGPAVYMLARNDGNETDLYAWMPNRPGTGLRRVTQESSSTNGLQALGSGRVLAGIGGGNVSVFSLGDARTSDAGTNGGATLTHITSFQGSSFSASPDGRMLAYLTTAGDTTRVQVSPVDGEPKPVFEAIFPIANPALSPDGSLVVFEAMPRENRELYVAATDGSWSKRLTWEVQHDLFPRFVNNEQVFAVMGEGRHRRSYLHDTNTGERMRLFHNNTVRTVAPEYEWAISPDGSQVIVVAERDGDTISPERGIYLMDLTRNVSLDDVLERLRANLATEEQLRANGEGLFAPIAQPVRGTLSEVSTSRIYEYERDLFAFGSKFITQPGNAQAIEYLVQRLRSFGYEPELQTFEPREGISSSNVIATLQGTVDPDVVYVVSSHFDSVERGPGADDNTSGTSALLEAARVLADSPQPATIQFAFFTGEEAGLLGSREFVRRAVQDGVQLVGALNNDMIGYANDNRLDNTIRYSNAGIRDIQHAAAMLFTDLITYDAKYYKSTDAHAYYEAYGDIVGGIGSYPILGNPHYHQTHDVLETINHQLVAEVSKTTVASLMLLASSPSRLTGLKAAPGTSGVELSWNPAVESHVTGYDVRWMDSSGRWHQRAVQKPSLALENIPAGSTLEVRAVGNRRMPSWDAARVTAQ